MTATKPSPEPAQAAVGDDGSLVWVTPTVNALSLTTAAGVTSTYANVASVIVALGGLFYGPQVLAAMGSGVYRIGGTAKRQFLDAAATGGCGAARPAAGLQADARRWRCRVGHACHGWAGLHGHGWLTQRHGFIGLRRVGAPGSKTALFTIAQQTNTTGSATYKRVYLTLTLP